MFMMFKRSWEWLLLGAVLLILGLFLVGHDIFGMNGLVASALALVGGVLVTILSFLAATLILPLVALMTAAVGALLAVITTLLAFVVGGIFTPLAAVAVGWVTSLIGWLATTWLGSLLAPLYYTLAPLVLKIAPWLTTSKYLVKIYDWCDDQPWWPKQLVFTSKRRAKSKTKPTKTKPRRR